MPSTLHLPYGTWPSPITAEAVADASGSTAWPCGAGDENWWCASDPATATVRLLRNAPGHEKPVPVLAPGVSVRNRSLGYGGKPYWVRAAAPASGSHLLVYTDHRDQRLYRAEVPRLGTVGDDALPVPVPLTPADPPGRETCWADPVTGPDGTEVWCVRETTRAATGPHDADPAVRTTREIVAVPLSGAAADDPGALRVVARSHHFLCGHRLSPDGRRLAWIGWDHPHMPWNSSELMVADLHDGVAGEPVRLLGGSHDGTEVSVPQAAWANPDTLYAMADPDGWWNLHRVDLATDRPTAIAITNVLPLREDCAGPVWRVGASWFTVTPHGVVLPHGNGTQRLARWSPEDGELTELADGWDRFQGDLWSDGERILVRAASPALGSALLSVPVAPGSGPARRTRPESEDPLAPWQPLPERRTAYDAQGRPVHFVLHRPTHPTVSAAEGELPPLLVQVHGGPTSSTGVTADLEYSFFTSRGFTVSDVDYGGSTGYGRAYRDRLRGQWGVVDVDDCVTVARALAEEGLADPARTAVRGGSAGGWTTLACLAHTDVFCAGTVLYPISEPAQWRAEQTHDFESRYVDTLVGVLPQDQARFDEVSPAANADGITVPLVMLQGADDFICRPDQATRIVDNLAERGVWHRFLLFEGEGHGFRRADSVRRSLLAEVALYREVLGAHIAPDVPLDAESSVDA
ncbi:prolyl oligopeptidase family serine peptidase [Actinacidiphila glaucinigra]|uniref:prolyl oligopeptidase family serine peptidase n=1 Tax=Actinacidiphila glaucinigra TaxID=235986 RepID=UPI0037B7214B